MLAAGRTAGSTLPRAAPTPRRGNGRKQSSIGRAIVEWFVAEGIKVFACAHNGQARQALQGASSGQARFQPWQYDRGLTQLLKERLTRMDDLLKLQRQIAEMQKQADQLQKNNRSAVLAQLREQMAAYGITAEELSRPAPKPRRAPSKPTAGTSQGKKAATGLATKYRGPEGQQWSGRGPAPRWLSDLLVGGKTREDFLVRPKAQASDSAAE